MGEILRWYRFGPHVMTVAEFALLAGLSNSKVRSLIARGDLPAYRDAKYPILIPTVIAKRWMAGLPTPHGMYDIIISERL